MKRRLQAFLLICLLLVFALPAGAAQVAASGNLSLSINEDQMAFGLDHWLGRGDFFGDLLRESTPNEMCISDRRREGRQTFQWKV